MSLTLFADRSRCVNPGRGAGSGHLCSSAARPCADVCFLGWEGLRLRFFTSGAIVLRLGIAPRMLREDRSGRVSRAVACFSRYLERRSLGLTVASHGSVFVEDLFLVWGRQPRLLED